MICCVGEGAIQVGTLNLQGQGHIFISAFRMIPCWQI